VWKAEGAGSVALTLGAIVAGHFNAPEGVWIGLAVVAGLLFAVTVVSHPRIRPHVVTRHRDGTTLPPRAWDHLVPIRAGRP
jgi:tellurite resistance-related uncharacterized protein